LHICQLQWGQIQPSVSIRPVCVVPACSAACSAVHAGVASTRCGSVPFGAHRQGQLPSSSTNWRKVRHRKPNKTSCCTVTVSRQPASPPSTDRSIVFASWRQYVPRSNARFTGPTQVRLHRTASRSIQPLLHGSRACNVTNNRSDRQTDTQTYTQTTPRHDIGRNRLK